MPDHDIALMAHLMRRAGFGASRAELEARVAKGYEATVEELLHPESQPELDEDTLYRYFPNLEGPLAPVLFATRAPDLAGPMLEECFGPAALIVEYAGEEELLAALAALPGSLTATVHAGETETGLPGRLAEVLREKAGRLVWNGFPTGVAVAHAMTHGGPHPATTNALHTSVGATSVRRFLRSVTWQNAPDALLPPELSDPDPQKAVEKQNAFAKRNKERAAPAKA